MTENKKRAATRMVPAPSHGIIPERDFNERPVLEARNLGIDFGGLHAVEDFNLIIGKTEIAGLIGPNGAGKTTVFNLLTKVYQPTMGTIMLNGRDTAGMNTAQANKLGIARTFQNIRLFDNMSVEDNVRIGLHNQVRYGMLSGIFRMPGYWRGEREMHERALDLLSIFDMQDLANHQAGSLPYGAQRRLEIVRALHEPARDGGADGEHHKDPRSVPHRHPAHRTRHEPGHGHLRGHLRAQLRQDHREGHGGGNSE